MGVRPADAAGRAVTETWRPVVGFEGLYEVSDQGRVRSLDRFLSFKNHRRFLRGKLLRPGPMGRGGHMSVCLGERRTRTVHSLVMEAFVGPCPDGLEIRHRDGDERDNQLLNLEYATRSRNIQDKKWHRGYARHFLTPEQVQSIKRRLGPRGEGARLAREFGVSTATITAIKRGRIHQDVAA